MSVFSKTVAVSRIEDLPNQGIVALANGSFYSEMLRGVWDVPVPISHIGLLFTSTMNGVPTRKICIMDEIRDVRVETVQEIVLNDRSALSMYVRPLVEDTPGLVEKFVTAICNNMRRKHCRFPEKEIMNVLGRNYVSRPNNSTTTATNLEFAFWVLQDAGVEFLDIMVEGKETPVQWPDPSVLTEQPRVESSCHLVNDIFQLLGITRDRHEANFLKSMLPRDGVTSGRTLLSIETFFKPSHQLHNHYVSLTLPERTEADVSSAVTALAALETKHAEKFLSEFFKRVVTDPYMFKHVGREISLTRLAHRTRNLMGKDIIVDFVKQTLKIMVPLLMAIVLRGGESSPADDVDSPDMEAQLDDLLTLQSILVALTSTFGLEEGAVDLQPFQAVLARQADLVRLRSLEAPSQ